MHTSKVISVDKPNDSQVTDFNPLIRNLTKYLAKNSSVKFSGSSADAFNNNKFSLAKVAFPGNTLSTVTGSVFDAF